MLKTKPKTWASFVIRGDGMKPSQLTETLSLNPDFFVDPDIPNLQENKSHPHWQLNSHASPETSPEEHIFEILKKLAPKRNELRDLSQKFECILYLSVEFSDREVDGISISPRTLLLLGDLGVHLEFLPWLDE